jgi:hypothetical protein
LAAKIGNLARAGRCAIQIVRIDLVLAIWLRDFDFGVGVFAGEVTLTGISFVIV